MFATRTATRTSVFTLVFILLVALPLFSGFHPTAAARFDLQTTTFPLRSDTRDPVDTLIQAGAQSLPAESLAYVIQSGEVLILNLPTSFGSQPVDTYRLRRGPSLSWLVDRSYFWRTLAKDVGQHTIVFEGLYGGHRVEDVYVIVDVR